MVDRECSFTKDQNEGVVESFLATHGDAGGYETRDPCDES